MAEQIKFSYGNDEVGYCENLNKLKSEQKLLELLETEDVEEIKVIYKKENQLVLLITHRKD